MIRAPVLIFYYSLIIKSIFQGGDQGTVRDLDFRASWCQRQWGLGNPVEEEHEGNPGEELAGEKVYCHS